MQEDRASPSELSGSGGLGPPLALYPIPSSNLIIQGRKKQHKHKLFGPDFPIPDPYARMPSGHKVSPHHRGRRKRTFWRGRPRFRSGRPSPEGLSKHFVQKTFALIVWVLIMFFMRHSPIALPPPRRPYRTPAPLALHQGGASQVKLSLIRKISCYTPVAQL